MDPSNRPLRAGLPLAVMLIAITCAAAADPVAPRAARSVHLHYPAPDAELFYNEVTVDASVRGTYFCACGFSHGYFGIQELANGKKLVLFSVWDPGDKQRPDEVAADQRVEVLYAGDGVRIGRFGGEGTGAQSFFDHDWAVGQTCRFLVRAAPEGDKTAYAAYFFLDGEHAWKHLATFRTRTKKGGEPLRGLYSFVEDFRRDGKSPGERRSARFGNGWVRTMNGDWTALCRARFTGDATPLDNVDAGVKEGAFYLATGGATLATHALNTTVTREPAGMPALPDFTVSVPATQAARGGDVSRSRTGLAAPRPPGSPER